MSCVSFLNINYGSCYNDTVYEQIQTAVNAAEHIVVIQADNPDADSLGSALALEHILAPLSKRITLYCGVHIPDYLHFIAGWDRVTTDMPRTFDASIVVDASTYTLLEKLEQSGGLAWVKSRPCIILDHHAVVEKPLDFTDIKLIEPTAASTGEMIFDLSRQLGWPVGTDAAECIMASVLGDTQGLTNELATAATYRLMADLLELGVNRTALEDRRREHAKMPQKIYAYKGELLKRSEFVLDGAVCMVVINQAEINEFSPLYNPAALVHFDMLQVIGVRLAIVFKIYDDGRITAALRAGYGSPVAGKLAEAMGGGGHDYAAGFKITDGRTYETVRHACLEKAAELLDENEALHEKDVQPNN